MCRHKRITWPQTTAGRTHVSCLGCAAEIEYSAKYLRPLTRKERKFAELRRKAEAARAA